MKWYARHLKERRRKKKQREDINSAIIINFKQEFVTYPSVSFQLAVRLDSLCLTRMCDAEDQIRREERGRGKGKEKEKG